MAEFSCRKPLPSIEVSKELVKSLEQYLVAWFQDQSQPLPEKNAYVDEIPDAFEFEVSISIEDEIGEETFESIDEFAPTSFRDQTKKIVINVRGGIYTTLAGSYVEIRFGDERYNSKTTIVFKVKNARGLATGLLDGIESCLAPHRTNNWLFHPHAFVDGLLTGFAWTSLFAAVLFFAFLDFGGQKKPFVLFSLAVLITIAAIILYQYPLRSTRPYIAFRSAAYDRMVAKRSWFESGLAGTVIFGILLVGFFERLFGP